MGGGGANAGDKPLDYRDRDDLAITQPGELSALGLQHNGFREEVARWYSEAEHNATTRLTRLKADLREAKSEEEFWPMATEGLAELGGAQYAFISKRMVVDDADVNVEMPPIGTPGSCLMAQAWYYNDGHGQKGAATNIKYKAYNCPCEYMKHDKVLLIPEKLSEIFANNPNAANLIVPGEAYLGIPLFDRDGKCFAHFGVMYSHEGVAKLDLSWSFIEMMFHSLEDVILAGFLERGRFASALKSVANPHAVIPHDAVTAAQSLKPYARNLSHELRTPMQGVVGMLDVMYATVQEAAEGQRDPQVLSTLEILKENIEVAQDSSRRAVEAADNVVHAYDMGMGVPEMPISPPLEEDSLVDAPLAVKKERRPDIVVTGDNVPINFTGYKRRRGSQGDTRSSSAKQRKVDEAHSSHSSPREAPPLDTAVASMEDVQPNTVLPLSPTTAHLEQCEQTLIPPGLRHTNLRDLLQFLINDLLKVGGRPESAIAMEIDGGEEIEVRVRAPRGDEKIKHIRWTVDAAVPETILIEEQSLVKVISSVYSNAVKFTEEGEISVHARLSPQSRYVVLRVKDSGMGIRDEFMPRLFQAFSKEDDSLTRTSEGLGLGLMVAKGLARKLGGDLNLIRTRPFGANHGTEFEIRVPITPADICSRPTTPSGSPAPSVRSRRSTHDEEVTGHARARSGSWRSLRANAHYNTGRKASKSPPNETPSPPQIPSKRPIAAPLQRVSKVPRRASPSRNAHDINRALAQSYPLNFLVVEDNKINRKLLVNMLHKLGYTNVHEAYDGSHAVREMQRLHGAVDVVLMDLWMPYMSGYEAAERILSMSWNDKPDSEDSVATTNVSATATAKVPTILAVTADVTDGALERAATAGMKGFLTKPFKLNDLERLIVEYCASCEGEEEMPTAAGAGAAVAA